MRKNTNHTADYACSGLGNIHPVSVIYDDIYFIAIYNPGISSGATDISIHVNMSINCVSDKSFREIDNTTNAHFSAISCSGKRNCYFAITPYVYFLNYCTMDIALYVYFYKISNSGKRFCLSTNATQDYCCKFSKCILRFSKWYNSTSVCSGMIYRFVTNFGKAAIATHVHFYMFGKNNSIIAKHPITQYQRANPIGTMLDCIYPFHKTNSQFFHRLDLQTGEIKLVKSLSFISYRPYCIFFSEFSSYKTQY